MQAICLCVNRWFMFGKKLFAAIFGIILFSNCVKATDDFKDLNLSMSEKK